MNLFKKPKKAAPKAKVGPQLTKIYIKDFRRGVDHLGRPLARTEIVQPGLKEPDVAEWFDLIPIPFNSPAAMANEPGVIRTPSGQPARVNANWREAARFELPGFSPASLRSRECRWATRLAENRPNPACRSRNGLQEPSRFATDRRDRF